MWVRENIGWLSRCVFVKMLTNGPALQTRVCKETVFGWNNVDVKVGDTFRKWWVKMDGDDKRATLESDKSKVQNSMMEYVQGIVTDFLERVEAFTYPWRYYKVKKAIVI